MHDRDRGSTHVLEAVIIATIMVSAVAYVSTFESPANTGSSPSRAVLKQRADDALSILYDTPVTDQHGNNKLSKDLAECMHGGCDNLTHELKGLLPPGTSYAVYVSNGYKTYPVLVTKEPTGEAVTASQLMMPAWSNSFVTTGMTNVNPTSDSLLAYTLPIFNSNVLSQGGSPLRVLVTGERLSDHSNYSLTGFFSTAESDVSTATSAVSLTFRDLDTGNTPTGYVDPYTLNNWANDPPAPALGHYAKVVHMRLDVDEVAGVAIPAATELTVNMPRGWTATAPPGSNAAWTIAQDATDAGGTIGKSDIVARLNAAFSSGKRSLLFDATYQGDALDFYPFHATLAKGALSEANVLVRADSHGQGTVTEVPAVQLSLPRPMGNHQTTDWTLTVDVPAKNDNKYSVVKGSATQSQAAADERINIKTIMIQEQDGKGIFGSVSGTSSGVGAWSVSAAKDKIFWVGNYTVGATGVPPIPFASTLRVTGADVASAPGAKNSFAPPFNFSSWTGRGLSQVAPGFFRQGILPADTTYKGYDTTVDANGFGKPTDFSSNSIYRATALPGKSNYTSNPVSSLHDSVYGSYVSVNRRVAPIGASVDITADLQSMLFALSEAGVSAGVNVTVYPPWSGDDRTPVFQTSGLDAGVLRSDTTQLVTMDLNNDGFPDPIIGTTNGRVIAFNGLTGGRLDGKTFTVPVSGTNTNAVASVQQLALFSYGGQQYIVVSADKNGGLYVLDSTFSPVWRDITGPKTGLDTQIIDASHDVTGDGKNDILVALSSQGTGGSAVSNIVVYVVPPQGLPAPGDPPRALDWLTPTTPVPGAPGVIAQTPGASNILVGLPKIAFNGTDPGFITSFSNSAGASGGPSPADAGQDPSATAAGYFWVYNNGLIPNQPSGMTDGDKVSQAYDTFSFSAINGSFVPAIMTPKAGLEGFDTHGNLAWTVYGSPITAGQPYDYDGDGVPDFVVGSSAGYVTMQNGKSPASPLHAIGAPGSPQRIDAWMHDARVGATLYADTTVALTHDGFAGYESCTDCWTSTPFYQTIASRPHVGALSIAMNDTLSVWLVGKSNTLWRSVAADAHEFAEQPYFAPVAFNVTRNWAGNANAPVALGVLPSQTQVDLRSVAFQWGAARDNGWVVGGPLNSTTDVLGPQYGGEAFVARTTNGGYSWRELTALDSNLLMHDGTSKVTGTTLTRINFTDTTHGWITGTNGMVLRSLNGGASFQQIQINAPYDHTNFVDISCVPDSAHGTCLLVGEGGVLLRTTTGFDNGDPSWTAIALPSNAIPYSVAMAKDHTAILGAQDAVLRSYDDGVHWASLPMSYVQGNGLRSFLTPDGRGFVIGGNSTNDRVFFLQDYATFGQAQTAPFAVNPIASGAVSDFHLYVETGANDVSTNTKLGAYASFDGGATFAPMSADDGGHPGIIIQKRLDGTLMEPYSFSYSYNFTLTPPPGAGRNVVVKLHMLSDPRFMQESEQITRLTGYANTTGPTATIPLTWDLTQWSTFDATKTDINEWDPQGVIHQAPTRPYWNQNVTGYVQDIQTGFDANGDAKNDVWVGTGMTLAANSPDYNLYASRDPNALVGLDGRVYLLDGTTGTILHQSVAMPGNVTHLRVVDQDGVNGPDYVYATVDAPTHVGAPSATSYTYLELLDAKTLTRIWETRFANVTATDLEPGMIGNNKADALLATKSTTTGVTSNGFLTALDGDPDAKVEWQSLPDALGLYTITVPVKDEWFFGPYVVEASVKWTEDAAGAASTSKAVVQTARLYDYFMVTPPSLVNPPSPVYDVKLVTWYDDWR